MITGIPNLRYAAGGGYASYKRNPARCGWFINSVIIVAVLYCIMHYQPSSLSSTTGSTDKAKDLVHTNSGHLHFVDRRVTLGVNRPHAASPLYKDDLVINELDAAHLIPLKQVKRANSEGNLLRICDQQPGFVSKALKLGEQRTVIMDMHWTKFGFQLQVSWPLYIYMLLLLDHIDLEYRCLLY